MSIVRTVRTSRPENTRGRRTRPQVDRRFCVLTPVFFLSTIDDGSQAAAWVSAVSGVPGYSARGCDEITTRAVSPFRRPST